MSWFICVVCKGIYISALYAGTHGLTVEHIYPSLSVDCPSPPSLYFLSLSHCSTFDSIYMTIVAGAIFHRSGRTDRATGTVFSEGEGGSTYPSCPPGTPSTLSARCAAARGFSRAASSFARATSGWVQPSSTGSGTAGATGAAAGSRPRPTACPAGWAAWRRRCGEHERRHRIPAVSCLSARCAPAGCSWTSGLFRSSRLRRRRRASGCGWSIRGGGAECR